MSKIGKFFIFLVFAFILRQAEANRHLQSSASTNQANLTNLTPVEQEILAFLGSSGVDQATLLQALQLSGLQQIFSSIPQVVLQQMLLRLKTGKLDENPANYNPSTNFTNWAKTVDTNYAGILYPTEYSPYVDSQVNHIRSFVKEAAKRGKRVRGSGCRHSWSTIFSDPNQLLVSFYPFQIVDATSQAMDDYASRITKFEEQLAVQGVQHLNQIRKVGEINQTIKQGKSSKVVKKHLVKIGASVSNSQLRQWSIKNGYQYKSNVVLVEVNFCGALSTCSHGAGIDTQTLADYVYQIEFIDYEGNRQTISKKSHPKLIKSAAGSMGLLGIIIYVTIEMERLQIVKTIPRKTYKDFVIPWPKGYKKQKERLQREEYKQWAATTNLTQADSNWVANLNKFKEAIGQSYNQWFYFSAEGVHIFQNVWTTHAPKTPENIAKIFKNNGTFIDDYPPPVSVVLSEFSQFLGNYFAGDLQTQYLVSFLMKNPFGFFPPNNVYINYPDAIHYQRGIQNFKVRDLEVEINIPAINSKGKMEPDYDLIQQIWWTGLQFVEDNADVVNIGLQMRIFKGSQVTLAPEMGYDYVCSIEVIRTLTLSPAQQTQWIAAITKIFKLWKGLVDSNGKKVVIRPHWGKQWDKIPQVKAHLLSDQLLKKNMKKFLNDYQEIANLKGFNYMKNLQTFSNEIYRQLLNNVIGKKGRKIN